MSSREIAELVEKQHKNVLRDIETMLAQIRGLKSEPADFLSEYRDEQGKPPKEYRLPRDLTVTLVTGYHPDLRYKVVKRLEELEARVSPGIDVPAILGEPAAVCVPMLGDAQEVVALAVKAEICNVLVTPLGGTKRPRRIVWRKSQGARRCHVRQRLKKRRAPTRSASRPMRVAEFACPQREGVLRQHLPVVRGSVPYTALRPSPPAHHGQAVIGANQPIDHPSMSGDPRLPPCMWATSARVGTRGRSGAG